MDNPFFDAWFSAQARDPNSFVINICSTKQIDTHWQQWVEDTNPRPDNHAVHFGTNNAMQHVKAALRHRVFRDNLLANATPSMAAKYRDFERCALQVFRGLDDPNPPLGTLSAALQPYLYCWAHPSAKSWMAKFEVQHDLSLAPSYVKPFVPFDLPSATGVNPTVTSLVTLNASFALDRSGTPGAHSINSADTRGLSSADALAKLLGKVLVSLSVNPQTAGCRRRRLQARERSQQKPSPLHCFHCHHCDLTPCLPKRVEREKSYSRRQAIARHPGSQLRRSGAPSTPRMHDRRNITCSHAGPSP